jgi:16S rRNA (guanine527-N7)-methyltransferase
MTSASPWSKPIGARVPFSRPHRALLEVTPCILIDRESALPVSPTDILSARALAPLPTLLGWGYRHLRPSGRALFHKGVGHRREIDAALATWQFRVQKHASLSGDGTILEIDRLKPAGPPIGAGPMD